MKPRLLLPYIQAFFHGFFLVLGTSLATGGKVGLTSLTTSIGAGTLAAIKLAEKSPATTLKP